MYKWKTSREREREREREGEGGRLSAQVEGNELKVG